jgi:poly-gamma-glutamate capsule biosynthesis protein CapA/YwtB (metallophosphatase superfamily)
MSEIMMGFVGDVLVNRDNPREAFKDVREMLSVPDVMFANLEGAYTDDPHPAPGTNAMISGRASNLDVYSEVGFDVMSLANNHILDVGCVAMLENRARLRAQGVLTCGAGDCLANAREPAIADVEGLRVAFLGYASIFPVGYEAYLNIPGLVPVRAYDMWRTPMPRIHMPGAIPVARTVPDEGDLAHLREDIRHARERADLVVTSFHWGDQTRPFHLTDHEMRTARYCIDHGADMVVGHHHHAIRGMEWYKGKPIMYGLGHFVFDFRLGMTAKEVDKFLLELSPDGHWSAPYTVAPREGWPLLPMHEDTRMTVMAWAIANRQGVSDIGFLPCKLTPDGSVHPLKVDSPEGQEVVDYFGQCNSSQRLNGCAVADNSMTIAGFHTLRVVPTQLG